MSRNMQSKAQTKAQTQELLSTTTINLMATTTALALIVATAIILLFVAPANAATETHRPAPEQLIIWANELPNDFHATTARVGIHVVNTETVLGSKVVYIQPAAGQSLNGALQALASQFPKLLFVTMNGSAEDIKLVEN